MDTCLVPAQQTSLALDLVRHRYHLTGAGGEIYVGPVVPERKPGLSCWREQWVPTEQGWAEREKVF